MGEGFVLGLDLGTLVELDEGGAMFACAAAGLGAVCRSMLGIGTGVRTRQLYQRILMVDH